MEPFVNLEIELTIAKGRGYVPADENMTKDLPIGVIPVDAIYTPIKKYHTVFQILGSDKNRLRKVAIGH